MGFATNSESLTILSYFYVFVATLTTILNAGFGLEECKFPAIFNFGDSNSDTGGFAAAFKPPNPPYGETFWYEYHKHSGRYCDGRLIIDFMAEELNLPYLSPYLESLGSNFTHGADFSAVASTIRLPTKIMPQPGGYSPFDLEIQYQQFLQLKIKSHYLRKQGGVFGELVPPDEFFRSGLYTFDIGQNDLGNGFFDNKSITEVNTSVPDMINKFSTNVKRVYNLGARSFWIHNTGPIGCLAYILSGFPSYEKDEVGCSDPHNKVAQYFNYKLKEAVYQFREDLPDGTFTYVDIYSAKYSLYKEPEKYGFLEPLVVCCGCGGEYNYNDVYMCGDTFIVDGMKRVVGSCDRPWVRVDWDGIHYTEAANKVVFEKISSGAFSNPPVPLKYACHKTEYFKAVM